MNKMGSFQDGLILKNLLIQLITSTDQSKKTIWPSGYIMKRYLFKIPHPFHLLLLLNSFTVGEGMIHTPLQKNSNTKE